MQSTYHQTNVPMQGENVCLKVLEVEVHIATSISNRNGNS